MELKELKKNIADKLLNRDYYGMFELIDTYSRKYISGSIKEYEVCVELINQNQDLYEYMGASKQYEMAFELHNKLVKNRNQLFLSCLDKKPELKPIFKRCVGDYSVEY